MTCRTSLQYKTDLCILTSNQRLTQQLKKQHNPNLTQGQLSFVTPNITSLQHWLQGLYQNSYQSKQLLSDFEETALWEKVLKEQTQGLALIDIPSLADNAKRAFRLQQTYLIPQQVLAEYPHTACEHYIKWSEAFVTKLEQQHSLTTSQLYAAVATKLDTLTLPKHIELHGFDEIVPALTALLNALQSYCNIEIIETIELDQVELSRTELHEQADEIAAMAQWAAEYSEQNPSHRVACIVPELNSLRYQLVTQFTQTFCSKELLEQTEGWQPPFNISAAPSLNSYACIQVALATLQLLKPRIDFENLSTLCKTPYLFHSIKDRYLATELELFFREREQLSIKPSDIINQLNNIAEQATWSQRWQQLIPLIDNVEHNSRRSAEDWVTVFYQLWQSLGWPGGKTLSSNDYQTILRWQSLLEEFSQSCAQLGNISIDQAIYWLTRMSHSTLFQPQLNNEVNIHILGTLEAAGEHFDAAWIMGLSDKVWPNKANPNPLLPFALQTQYGVAHANAEREFLYAQTITKRLLNIADKIIVSSSQFDGDEQLSPSSLISHLPFKDAATLVKQEIPIASSLYETRPVLEETDDDYGPALLEKQLHGGSYILQLQANCPFQAFAKGRLQADGLTEPTLGLDAADKGSLMHAVLEQVWQQLKTQHALLQLTQEQRNELVEQTTKQVLEKAFQHMPLSQQQAFKVIEQQRISQLIQQWLELERLRPSFQVLEQEQASHVTINGVQLNLRMDRVDQLSDGSSVIIDYKTGANNRVADWFDDIPRTPQLPLYNVFAMPTASALAYAEIRPGQLKFKGIAKRGDLLPGLIPFEKLNYYPELANWKELQKHWKQAIKQLVAQIQQGEAFVAPAYPDSCQYCDLHGLCRVDAL